MASLIDGMILTRLRKRPQLRLSLTARVLIIIAGFWLITTVAPKMTAAPPQSDLRFCSEEPKEGCREKVKFDLAFIVDASVSVAKRGQSYNIELEGIARAARNSTIIPPDGSISLAVITFDETAVISVPLTTINSAADAEAFAIQVENLPTPDRGAEEGPCQCGTNYSVAINTADNYLSKNRRPGAHRILLMSSDGEPTDARMGVDAASQANIRAAAERVVSELDVILIGLDTEGSEFSDNKAKVDRIVFPKPDDELPGATLVIKGGQCNRPEATLGGDDCDRQSNEFAENVRKILRSHIPATKLVVTTEADLMGPVVIGDGAPPELSLRQAIELANCNQGSATITFADSVRGKTIRPVAPLPNLTAPDIVIDGCGQNGCDALVTIDGGLLTSPLIGEDEGDGILVRSNHNVIRGLKIANFKRAGVAVAPICPFDFPGNNIIQSNTIENNGKAGVLILDPRLQVPLPNLTSLTVHNTGNTISKNTFLQIAPSTDAMTGKPTLIDLGGDGLTLNDDNDADVGPNTLINYPKTLTLVGSTISVAASPLHTQDVAPAAATVTLTGQAVGPTAANATVEIYSVTDLKTSDCSVVITGVVPIAEVTTDAAGVFIASGIPMSPTMAYTATITDRAGNTSEFPVGCAGSARALVTLQGNQAELKFEPITARPKQKNLIKLQGMRFRIQNVGCSPLEITNFKILRDAGLDCVDEICRDDTKYFSITRLISAGPPVQEGPLSLPIVIGRGECRDFLVRFNPIIPASTSPNVNQTAAQVLPDSVMSKIKIGLNDSSVGDVNLVGHVRTAVKLIDGNNPKNPPVIKFERSGNELTATYYIYDSNRDVQIAEYKFFDGAGNTVPLTPVTASLKDIIENRKVRIGQSFTIVQKFTNANERPETKNILVKISDGETSVSAMSGAVRVITGAAKTSSLRNSRGETLVLPTVRLSPQKSEQRKKYE